MADTSTCTSTSTGHQAHTPTPGRNLRVKHCATRHGEPLADVYGLPGDGAELRPADMRELAALLLAAAADCEALPIEEGRRQIERSYPAALAPHLQDAVAAFCDALAFEEKQLQSQRGHPAGEDDSGIAWQKWQKLAFAALADGDDDDPPRPQAAAAPAKHPAAKPVSDLWFTLDQIEAVAYATPFILERGREDPEATEGRIDGLAGAICRLVAVAKDQHEEIEQLLPAA